MRRDTEVVLFQAATGPTVFARSLEQRSPGLGNHLELLRAGRESPPAAASSPSAQSCPPSGSRCQDRPRHRDDRVGGAAAAATASRHQCDSLSRHSGLGVAEVACLQPASEQGEGWTWSQEMDAWRAARPVPWRLAQELNHACPGLACRCHRPQSSPRSEMVVAVATGMPCGLQRRPCLNCRGPPRASSRADDVCGCSAALL